MVVIVDLSQKDRTGLSGSSPVRTGLNASNTSFKRRKADVTP